MGYSNQNSKEDQHARSNTHTVFAALAALLSYGPGSGDSVPPLTPNAPIIVSGGAAKFDYMIPDGDNNRIFASHSGASKLVVIDTAANTVTQIDCGTEVNGIAVDAKDNKVFVAGGGGTLFAYDRKTLAKVDQVTLPGPGDFIAFDPKNDELYVNHDAATEIWAFDGKTDKLKATITVDKSPETLVVDPKAGRLYQASKGGNSVQEIDAKTNKVMATWPAAPADKPHGMVIDPLTSRLFLAGGAGKLVVIDAKSGTVTGSVNIAAKVDQVCFDPKLKRIDCASGPGTISVVQETADGAQLLADVPSSKNAHTIAVDPNTGNVWICYMDDINSYVQSFNAQ